MKSNRISMSIIPRPSEMDVYSFHLKPVTMTVTLHHPNSCNENIVNLLSEPYKNSDVEIAFALQRWQRFASCNEVCDEVCVSARFAQMLRSNFQTKT